jgi:hypothetical protein
MESNNLFLSVEIDRLHRAEIHAALERERMLEENGLGWRSPLDGLSARLAAWLRAHGARGRRSRRATGTADHELVRAVR